MKKIGVCLNCERELYTNDLDLCKRCYQDVGLEFLKDTEPEEEIEEEGPHMPEGLVLEEGSEESEEKAEEKKEDTKEK